MRLSRRSVLIGSAATAIVAALPMLVSALPAPIADMFYTEDEPWGAFVRGHVPKDQFDQAILRMIDTNRDHRENGEDWLWEAEYDDEGEQTLRVVAADPDYLYMRVDHIDQDLCEQYVWCGKDDAGAIPITAVRY